MVNLQKEIGIWQFRDFQVKKRIKIDLWVSSSWDFRSLNDFKSSILGVAHTGTLIQCIYFVILTVTSFLINIKTHLFGYLVWILIMQWNDGLTFKNWQLSSDLHKKRLDVVSWFLFIFVQHTLWELKNFLYQLLDQIRTLMESSHPEANMNNNPKEIVRQGLGNPVSASHLIRPSLSSEQLVSQSTGSQMLHQMTRF